MEVSIEKLDHYGRGITKINNKICFIKNALPNEIVKIKLTKNKKNYLEGEIIKYIKKSPQRKKELCPYSNICGGCSLNHIDIKEENKFKEEKVLELINKFTYIKDIKIEKIKNIDDKNYRNKVIFHVKNKKLGFYKESSNDLVEIDKCLLLDNQINELIPILKKLVSNNKIKEIMVKVGNITNEIMVEINGNIKNDYKELLNKVDVLIINNKVYTNKKSILSIIDNKKYIISNRSFFQINKSETKNLYDEVVKIVKSKHSKNVLDLYCGTGTIGIYINSYVDNVLGIEVVKEAIDDANKNKELNNCNNIDFICSKVEDIIFKIDKKYDTVIVDPPRSGLDKMTINTILKMKPNTIIYISCDPATLARDLNLLKENYIIEYIKPFNMFPKTYHVECVCVLKLK